MRYRGSIGALALMAALSAMCAGALAFDQSKYPDWKGQWGRVRFPGVAGQPSFDQTKSAGAGQEAPLTPEYQRIFEANLADQAAGGQGTDPTSTCLSPGMPRIMTAYEPMEIVITPETTHILMEHIHETSRGSTPTGATGRRTSSRRSRAIPSANGATRTAPAATPCWRSRPAASRGRAPMTPPASRCTRTTRPSSRSGSISPRAARTYWMTRSPSTIMP